MRVPLSSSRMYPSPMRRLYVPFPTPIKCPVSTFKTLPSIDHAAVGVAGVPGGCPGWSCAVSLSRSSAGLTLSGLWLGGFSPPFLTGVLAPSFLLSRAFRRRCRTRPMAFCANRSRSGKEARNTEPSGRLAAPARRARPET